MYVIPADRLAGSGTALRPGEVWLVGAGPGDPDLLTLRAAAAIGAADVILYDRLAAAALVHARPDALRIPVGKRKGAAELPQAAITTRLIAEASAGRRVVRLKGGDPFLFGRGGEEVDALAAAGIPWRVVPGVSAATAAPSAAGIPLTVRGVASAVTLVTGHGERGALPDTVDWNAIARTGGTIVAFMALTSLASVALRLLAGGMSSATPVAVISRASLPGAFAVRTTLGACSLDVRRAAVVSPATVVIGAVVARAEAIRETWDEVRRAAG